MIILVPLKLAILPIAQRRHPAPFPLRPFLPFAPGPFPISPSNLTPNVLRKNLETLALSVSRMPPSCLDEPYNPALCTLSLPQTFLVFSNTRCFPGGIGTDSVLFRIGNCQPSLFNRAAGDGAHGNDSVKENHAPAMLHVLETDFRSLPSLTTIWFIIRSLVRRRKKL